MFCFNEAANQTDSSDPLDPEDGCSESEVQPISSWMPLWLHVVCVFCPTTPSQRLREPQTNLRLFLTLCRFWSSSGCVSPENSFPPLPPTLTSPASLCTISQHSFCSLRGKFRERVTKSQQPSEGMSSAFRWSEHCLIYEALLCLSCSQTERIYLQKENNN